VLHVDAVNQPLASKVCDINFTDDMTQVIDGVELCDDLAAR
jgi:hypothetical protein